MKTHRSPKRPTREQIIWAIETVFHRDASLDNLFQTGVDQIYDLTGDPAGPEYEFLEEFTEEFLSQMDGTGCIYSNLMEDDDNYTAVSSFIRQLFYFPEREVTAEQAAQVIMGVEAC